MFKTETSVFFKNVHFLSSLSVNSSFKNTNISKTNGELNLVGICLGDEKFVHADTISPLRVTMNVSQRNTRVGFLSECHFLTTGNAMQILIKRVYLYSTYSGTYHT